MIFHKHFSRRDLSLFGGLFVLFIAGAAFGAAGDNAGNYTASPNTFIDGANEGTGFDAWAIGLGADATAQLADSTEATGDINSPNGYSFRLYGGPGMTYAGATRDFAALAPGDVLSFKMAYHDYGGVRGVDLGAGANFLWLQYGLGNQLRYGIGAGPGVVLDTNYAGAAVMTVAVTQLADNKLEMTLTRNDGWTTNIVTGDMSAPLDGMYFYNGGHEGNDVRLALYFNDLTITDGAPLLALKGRAGMPAPYTNVWTVARNGSTAIPLDVTLSSTAPGVASVPVSVQIPAGQGSVPFEVAGVDKGTAYITASAAGFPDEMRPVEVFNVAYDDSSYYTSDWTNEPGGGAGFDAWVFNDNGGAYVGYTNHVGAFLGDSTAYGGGNVNSSSNNAFGLYANQEGDNPANEPTILATRSFPALTAGQTVTVDLGVKYRNGSKGVLISDSGDNMLFKVDIGADDYWYEYNGPGGTRSSIGWTEYADDTAIRVELTRLADNQYRARLVRSGAYNGSVTWPGISLNGVPSGIRLFVDDTEAGGDNNLFFNRMGINRQEVLSLDGVPNIDVGGTTTLTLTRTGPASGELEVILYGGATGTISMPLSVVIPAGQSSVDFQVTGVMAGMAWIDAVAGGFVSAMLGVEVFPFPDEWDDAGNYSRSSFTNESNGGKGFGPWQFVGLSGGGFIELRDSRATTAWMNSVNVRAFGFFGGTDSSYATASRALTAPLAEGDRFECELGMNWSGGHRGVDIKNAAGLNLFNFDLSFENVSAYAFGFEVPTDLGWGYNITAVVHVAVQQLAGNQLSVTLTRNDGLNTNVTSSSLTEPMSRVSFYNGGHVADSLQYALCVNDLLITRSAMTDGIPNAWWEKYGVPPEDRVRGLDLDLDGAPNEDEYAGDTDPTDITRVYSNKVLRISGNRRLNLLVGPNTTNSRIYDVWWSSNLVAVPQVWTPFNLNAAANPLGGPLTLTITTAVPRCFYRSGVIIP